MAAIAAFLYQIADVHIISASPPGSPSDIQRLPFFANQHLDRFTGTILQAICFGNIAQLILNMRSKTFAGLHPFGAYCSFADSLCDAIPVMLHRHLGRDELMKPLMMGHALELALKAWQAWQATAYPVVKQEEPESE